MKNIRTFANPKIEKNEENISTITQKKSKQARISYENVYR